MSVACTVCGDATGEHTAATCSRCGGTYHLALRIDVPTRECGQVWIDEDLLALLFACDTCLGATPTTPVAHTAVDGPPRRRYVRREPGSPALRRPRPGRRGI